ncbi:unnamed protein product [Prunus armeniaca]|uniref:Omega-hydroxypalmitate O-feruloyl transferase n=1 Tax=Prunus armeniaca TaxID=36596 RepID=A0A6J5VC17_PRUAR|nr:unnamed protein product [Prunus armeniaca]
MGSVHDQLTLLQDLKVTVHHSCLVFPSQQTQKKTVFLSNIDQVLNFDVQTVHFFGAHKDFPESQIVAEKVQDALAQILVPYDFLAGRLKLNPNTSRLEIDCNAAGAGFVVASSEYALDEIGDLVYPNSAFAQLVCTAMDSRILNPAAGDDHDQPLFILQVTTFKCGGFAMGISNNHTTVDGLSFRLFLDNLAAVAANKPLVAIPYNDRHILAARSPPHVPFLHPELQELKNMSTLDDLNPTVFEATQEELDFNIFRLTATDVARLKDKAKSTTASSSFNVVTAFIWRCKALSSSSSSDDDEDVNYKRAASSSSSSRESRILYAVDIRPRLKPPLPKAYTGNAVLTAYASAKCRELEEVPFSRMVEMVSEGATRMTDEYARSVIDWGELHKGFPHGEVLVSSWWRLGFADVEYPWGKPRYSCPVVYHRKDIILLFPEQQDMHEYSSSTSPTNTTTMAGRAGSAGVNILVALPHKEMQKFQALFHKFLLDD